MKKLLSLFLIFATVLLVCTGCKPDGNDETPEETKYDVSMKIVIEGVGEYIFTPDVSELTVTIPYDGVSRKVYLTRYQFPNHPMQTHRESWFVPDFDGADNFKELMLYQPPGGVNKSTDKLLVEAIGCYTFSCITNPASKTFNFRRIDLIIIVE